MARRAPQALTKCCTSHSGPRFGNECEFLHDMICRKGEEMATPGTKKQIDPKLAQDQKNVPGHSPENSPVDLTQPTEQSNPLDQDQQNPSDGSEENAGDKGNPPD